MRHGRARCGPRGRACGGAGRGREGDSAGSILDLEKSDKTILIFGNEARGLPDIAGVSARVSIPMSGKSESLNVASAAAIAMFEVGIR